MHTDTGTVKLYSYDTGTDSFTELHTFFETAQFNRDVIWTNCLAYGNGTVYMVSPDYENTLLYYNTQDGAHGAIPVTGIPSPMRLAETYDDFANEHSITLPHLTISPDSRYLFSTVFDPSDSKVRDAVINLDTGQCTILKSYGKDAARSHFAAFNEDSTILACSTDYRILLYSNGFSSQDEISIDGLNVSTMTWFKNDLWVKFTNNTVRRYNAEGELISDIALDYNQSTRFTLNTKWAAVPITDSEEALMLIDSGDMNLLSPNDSTVTPILHVPDFVGWNNDSDTFLVLSPDPGEDHNEDTGLPGLYIYSYPRYTTLDLIRLGEKQLRDMAEQAK